jgi:hypothetical protein
MKCNGCGKTQDKLELPDGWRTITEVLANGTGSIYMPRGYLCEVCSTKPWQYDPFDAMAFLHGYQLAKGMQPTESDFPKLLKEFETAVIALCSYGCQMNAPKSLFDHLASLQTKMLACVAEKGTR